MSDPASPRTAESRETYALHPFRVGGYLTDPAPDNRCVWRVDGHSPYCGVTRADHDDVLAQRRAGTWDWPPPPDDERLRAARFVATHWRDAVMASDELRRTGMSHPLAMVLGALDGETDPRELGLSDDVHDAFRAVLSDEPGETHEEPR